MILNIRLADSKIESIEMYEKVGCPIHKSLVGSKDYVNSNVILNLDKENGIPSCNLAVAIEYCEDKEFIRDKLKKAIDLYLDSI